MRLAIWTTVIVLALDQALKWWIVVGLNLAERLYIEVVPDIFTLRMTWNRGVNFGLLAGDAPWLPYALSALSVGVTIGVWIWVRREGAPPLMQIALGILAGGALGNSIDRLIWGGVADFLNVTCCGFRNPWAFNIADIAVFVGAFGLIMVSGGKTARDDPPGMG